MRISDWSSDVCSSDLAGLDYASSLGEVAAQLGVSTRALQEYRYAASQAGIEQAEMDKALSQLTRRLGDAAQGVKEPLAALERLGVTVRDSEGPVRDAGEALPLIAEARKKNESPAAGKTGGEANNGAGSGELRG